jgi:co-chaperonin GroES (HSP10)
MLYPLNKYLVVEPVDEADQSQEMTVLIPDGVQVESSRYKLVKLIEPNIDSKLRPGMRLLTPSHLIEETSISGEKYYLISEGHVIAFYEEE